MKENIIQNLRPAVTALESFLKNLSYGDYITFPKLKEVSGVDIQNSKYRYILETAKRRLLRHHQRVLISVRGKGYQIGTPDAVIIESASYRKRSYNSAKKAYRIVSTVDLSKLSEEEKLRTINEQCKSGLLLVAYKATENKVLNNSKDHVRIPEMEESSLVRMLIEKSQK
jgi:hypothetical protein